MQGRTHRGLSLAILLADLPPIFHRWAEAVAAEADLPDRVEDITVGRFGTKIAGHVLSALTHFTVQTSGGHFRGYCWRSDRSLWHCIRKFDPRVGDVACITEPWVPVVGRTHAAKHPLAMLLASLTGKATLDVDNFTFPTSAVMASWVWSQTVRSAPLDLSSMPNPKAVGSVLHFIQDAAVWHHSLGMLSNRHSGFEDRIGRIYEREGHRPFADAASLLIDVHHGPCTARSIVESCARMSSAYKNHPDAERKTLALAVAWTRAFVHRCLMVEL